VDGLDEAAGEDADEGDLFKETGGIGGFDPGEITLGDTAGVEAMLEGIEVAGRGAAAARGRGHGREPREKIKGRGEFRGRDRGNNRSAIDMRTLSLKNP
jgi:hypothetical protein